MKFHISSSWTWVTGRFRSKCVLISVGFGRGSHEPRQDRLLAHAKHERDPRQIHSDQKHLQGHHHLLFKAIITFSSEVRRSKKTVSWVSEKVVSQCRHRKIRRFPLSVMYVEMALTLPLFIRLKSGHSALGHGCPQSLGRLMRQSSDQVGMLKT